jgi:ribosomal protein S18 acetylase RimI-like enzyme
MVPRFLLHLTSATCKCLNRLAQENPSKVLVFATANDDRRRLQREPDAWCRDKVPKSRTYSAGEVMTVRRADSWDVGAVQRISAEAYIPAYEAICGFIPKPAFEDYRPRIERGEVWILETAGQPAAVAVLEERPDHLMIYSIAVRPEDQRKGLGASLLRFADERAAAIGVSEIRLYTNERMERNIALYRRHGFQEVGMRPHPSRPGDVLVDMVKMLTRDSSV